jgi:ribosomal 30S subunit maturation factor RimM
MKKQNKNESIGLNNYTILRKKEEFYEKQKDEYYKGQYTDYQLKIKGKWPKGYWEENERE